MTVSIEIQRHSNISRDEAIALSKCIKQQYKSTGVNVCINWKFTPGINTYYFYISDSARRYKPVLVKKKRSDIGSKRSNIKGRCDKGGTHVVLKGRCDRGKKRLPYKPRCDKGLKHNMTKIRADKGGTHKRRPTIQQLLLTSN
jgi:hypothetical protein